MQVRVSGRSAFAKELAIRCELEFGVGPTQLSIVCDWGSAEELGALADRIATPWTIVERVADESAGVGPIFGAADGVCLDCFLRRRKSNGGFPCVPISDSPPGLLEFTVEICRRSLYGEPALASVQGVWGPEGATFHPCAPVPGCPICEKDAPKSVCTYPSGTGRLGLVKHFVSATIVDGGLTGCFVKGCNTEPLIGLRALNDGFPVDSDPGKALIRATAESLERYCAVFPRSTWEVALDDKDSASYLSSYATALSPGSPCASSLNVVWGSDLSTREKRLVPASLVYFPYRSKPTEPKCRVQSSNGLAAGLNLGEATKSAVLELVERDAFEWAWEQNVPLPEYPVPAFSTKGLRVFKVPTSWPVHVGFAVYQTRYNVGFGLAARLFEEEACRAAALEAIASAELTNFRAGSGTSADRPGNSPPSRFVPGEGGGRPWRPWWSDGARATKSARSYGFAELTSAISPTIICDITTSDVRALGLTVVRAINVGLRSFHGVSAEGLGRRGATHPFRANYRYLSRL